jgi:hypothetical protein
MNKKPKQLAKNKERLTVSRLLELMERSLIESNSPKYGKVFDSPSDASQEYGKRLLEGKHKHSTVQQALIDIARSLCDSRTKSYEDRRNIHLAGSTELENIMTSYNPTNNIDNRILLIQTISKLNARSQEVMILNISGYTDEEISRYYRCTPGWVCKLRSTAIRDIKLMINSPTKKTRRK